MNELCSFTPNINDEAEKHFMKMIDTIFSCIGQCVQECFLGCVLTDIQITGIPRATFTFEPISISAGFKFRMRLWYLIQQIKEIRAHFSMKCQNLPRSNCCFCWRYWLSNMAIFCLWLSDSCFMCRSIRSCWFSRNCRSQTPNETRHQIKLVPISEQIELMILFSNSFQCMEVCEFVSIFFLCCMSL